MPIPVGQTIFATMFQLFDRNPCMMWLRRVSVGCAKVCVLTLNIDFLIFVVKLVLAFLVLLWFNFLMLGEQLKFEMQTRHRRRETLCIKTNTFQFL